MTAHADNVDEEFEMYSELPFHILGILRVVIAIFGIVTNTMSITVLTHKSIWSATSVLLISLVVYDTLFLLATAIAVITGLIPTVNDSTIMYMASITFPIRFIMQVGSIYSTVALTVERFIVVVMPFKAKVIWTMTNARRVILAVFLFTIAFNIPRFIVFPNITSPNITDDEPVLADSHEHFLYSRVYEVYLTLVIFYVVPYAVIMTLNIRLLIQLRRSAKETRRISTRQDQRTVVCQSPSQYEDGLTIIVLGLTSCFFVCCVMPMTVEIMMVFTPDLFSEPSKVYLQPVSDTMLCINSASDFIFYCLLGRRFREIFCRLFCRWNSGKRQRFDTGVSTITSRDHSRAASVELLANDKNNHT